MGLCMAIGMAAGSVMMGSGSPLIMGRDCRVHLLNAEAA